MVYADHSAFVSHPALRHTLMRFTIALLGLELDITLGPAGADDEAAAAQPTIGGETGTTWLDTGTPDRYMGFTGGWESDDDDE